jgi:aminopeptidase
MKGDFGSLLPLDPQLRQAADVALGSVLRAAKGEKVLIVSNPLRDAASIAMALYDSAQKVGALPVVVFQEAKTILDFAEESTLAAIASKPDIFISVTHLKLGKDRGGIHRPYVCDGKSFLHIFRYLLWGTKELRSFWSPSATTDMFARTVPLDYRQLRRECRMVKEILDRARWVTITTLLGTDLRIGVGGREATADDGDFSKPGRGGNLPAGETFISPELETAGGRIVYDGSLAVKDGVVVLKEPVSVEVEGGFVTRIDGHDGADRLKETIEEAERKARLLEEKGELAKGLGETYARNARNIGELGIGLNRKARLSGRMLEDEKVYGTCHVAIGSNYDEDAPTLIHLDGLITRPTVTAVTDAGAEKIIMKDGQVLTD